MFGLTKRQFNLIALLGSMASLVSLALYFWPTHSNTGPASPVTASGSNSIAVGTMSGGTIAPNSPVLPASSGQVPQVASQPKQQ